MTSSPALNVDEINRTLATTSLGRSLHLHDQLPSTNKEAMTLAQNGAPHGTVVIAECQSAGRGRQGRTWFSPPGVNLYCSVLIRGYGTRLALSEWLSWVPLVSALAVAESVFQTTSIPLSLKWPNDLLLNTRKVGGILCESLLTTNPHPAIVIGIGLNVNVTQTSLPDELQSIATSLTEATQAPIDRNLLLAQLLLELERCLDELRSNGASRLCQAYTTRCMTLGRLVRAIFPDGKEVTGTAESLSRDGALQLRPRSLSQRVAPLMEIRAADILHLRE